MARSFCRPWVTRSEFAMVNTGKALFRQMTTAARPGLDPKPTGLRSLEDSPEVRANSRAECDAERNKIQQAFLGSTSVHATLQALCEMAERNIQEGLLAASHAHNRTGRPCCSRDWRVWAAN